MLVSFNLNEKIYKLFVPTKEREDDWSYFRWPLTRRAKSWGSKLTLAELGLLVVIAEHCTGNGGTSVVHWRVIDSTSGRHSKDIVSTLLVKFEQLGILSDLKIALTNKLTNILTSEDENLTNNINKSKTETKSKDKDKANFFSPPSCPPAPIVESETLRPTPQRVEKVQIKAPSRQCIEKAVYQPYPRKLGKTKGLDKLQKIIKSEEDLCRVVKAVENYKNYLVENKQESQYIKHFSTFVSSWEDWADHDAGKVSGLDHIEKDEKETQEVIALVEKALAMAYPTTEVENGQI